MSVQMSIAEEIIMGFKQAKGSRSVVETTWEDIVYYTNPRKRGVTTEITAGEKTPSDIYDATASQSNIILAAGLSGFLTNAAQRWFELKSRRAELQDESDEQLWFSACTNIMYNVLAESNFYHQIHEAYLDFGPFGTAVLYLEEDPVEDLRFYARHPRECYLIEDEREMVKKLYRSFPMNAYSAYRFFGANMVSEPIRKAVEDEKDFSKKFDFIHFVGPRTKRDARRKNAINKPFMSVWIEEKTPNKVLKESGFDEFPFFTPRFYKNSCEVYGYGPGHVVFPDIKMLNDMTKVYYESAETAVYPPLIMEHDSIIGSLDLRAKALNYQRQQMSRGVAVQPIKNGANFQVGIDFIGRVEEKIKQAFFVDLFLATRQTKRMTATEVVEMSQERMFMLGPVLGRLQSELLTPVLSRAFNILLRRGKFPTPPASLQGVQEFDIVYTSPLARAQRAMQSRDMQQFLGIISQIAAAKPEILDLINADAVGRELHEMHSLSPKIINSPDTVEEVREERAEQLEAAQQQASIQQTAEVAKTAGQAAKEFAGAEQ